MSTETYHLMLKFREPAGSLLSPEVLRELTRIIGASGEVWFGNWEPCLQHYIDLFNDQISAGIPTYAYFVVWNRSAAVQNTPEFTVYQQRLLHAQTAVPDTEMDLIPAYYVRNNLVREMKLWLKFTGISRDEAISLKKMRVIGMSLMGAMVEREYNILFFEPNDGESL